MKAVAALLFYLPATAFAQIALDDWYGQWTGSYSGGDSGTCNVTISFSTMTQAIASGSCVSDTGGEIHLVSGQIALNGALSLTAGTTSTGEQFTGTLQGLSGSGHWVNSFYEVDGTFAISKAPAPFPVTITGEVNSASATVATRIAFNATDVGKSGAVFVTAMTPAGALVSAQAATDERKALLAANRANSTGSSMVLVQLTASGWQPVVNGQLLPYATGVLGEQLAAQSILNGADTASLRGAEFCLGYGTSAGEMVASARMRPVLTIPDPNSAGGASGSCVVSSPQTGTVQSGTPQSGWWWNPAESGRGYSIEVSGNTLFMAAYLYDGSGRATWYVSAGALNADRSYSGQLLQYGGGQSLTGPYSAPYAKGSGGTVALVCRTESVCDLTWAGGTVPIQRLTWDPATTAAGSPQTGWWWNAAESGRGYFLEQQGNTLFVSGYLYDAAGNDIWYIGSGAKSGNLFTSTWGQYGNGQTMTGPYKAPALVDGNVGSLKIEFSDTTSGQLTFPDGRVVQISRYRF